MDLTPNLGLGKPLVGENYDVDVPNTNMDILDAEVDSARDRLSAYDAALGLVPWADYTAYVSSAGAAWNVNAAGVSGVSARYCRMGKIVFASGSAAVGTAITDVSVSLPQGAGLVPHHRVLELGTLIVIHGGGGAPEQTGIARMNADLKRLTVHADTGGYRDAPAGSAIYWHVWYEVT